MAIRVRTCRTLAEFKQAVGAISEYGGWEVDDDIAKRFLRVHPLDHMHAAFDGRRAVGGAGAFPFDMSVPGGSVACAGVTVVGVYPTHRRQGVLTAMMRAQLDAAHERGEPIAALWASDERIYGRYGYGLASLTGEIELPRTHAEFAAPIEDPGMVGYVEPKDVPKVLGPIWKHVFRERPGMFARSAEWWKSRIAHDPPQWRRGAGPRRYAVVELGGSVEVMRSTATTRGGRVASPTQARWRSARCSRARSRPRSRFGAISATSSGRAPSPRGCSRSTTHSGGSSPSRAG